MDDKNKKVLWLDDWRNPYDQLWEETYLSNYKHTNIIWVKTYKQFVDYISTLGIPDVIFFDHDLGDNFKLKVTEEVGSWFDFDNDREYTGDDCAKWLVEYCLDNNLNLPEYYSQSSNPAGQENIMSRLNNYQKFKNENG